MPKSQADQRRDIVATDELGRPWLVATELKTGDPTGQIYPCRGETEWKGFADEEIPPQQYLRVPKNKWGQSQPDRLEIDFDRWRDDVHKANDAWRRLFHTIGQKVYKNAFNPEIHRTDEYLLDLTGPKPSPSVEAIDKMIAARKAKMSKRVAA